MGYSNSTETLIAGIKLKNLINKYYIIAFQEQAWKDLSWKPSCMRQSNNPKFLSVRDNLVLSSNKNQICLAKVTDKGQLIEGRKHSARQVNSVHILAENKAVISCHEETLLKELEVKDQTFQTKMKAWKDASYQKVLKAYELLFHPQRLKTALLQ